MAFEAIPGDPASRVILHVPHASTYIPVGVRRRILLGDAALATELAHITDAHTDLIAEQAAAGAAVRPHVFVNRMSRLVVDPERFPDEREEMRRVGMGAVYTRTTHGDALRDSEQPDLLARYYHPYARAMTSTVDKSLEAGTVTLIDVHSYPSRTLPYELHGDQPRPEICLGTDDFHTPPELLEPAREAFGDAGENTPFAGCYVPLKHYRHNPKVRAIMIEIRRDTYMREPGGRPHDGMRDIVGKLVTLVDRVR